MHHVFMAGSGRSGIRIAIVFMKRIINEQRARDIITSTSSQSSRMAPIKTCVLGTGLSSLTFQVPFVLALPDLFSLHAVLERNPTSEGGRVKDRFGVLTKIHRSFEDVLADKEVELIIY